MGKIKKQLAKTSEWNTDWAEYPWTTAICPYCNEHLKYTHKDATTGDILECYCCREKFELDMTDFELRCPDEMDARQFVLLLPEEKRKVLLGMLKEVQSDLGDCNGIVEAEGAYNFAIELLEKTTVNRRA